MDEIQTGLATQDEQREGRKRKFLDAMASVNNITAACLNANISRQTYYEWRHNGFLTQDDLDLSYEAYKDTIRATLHQRALSGVSRQLYQNGKPVFDANHNPVMITVTDNKLLLALAQKHLPEMKESDKLNVLVQQGDSDMPPADFCIVFDARKCNQEQLATIERILLEIEDRETNTVESGFLSVAEAKYQQN